MSEPEVSARDNSPADRHDAAADVDLRTDRAHGARIYDYILGGKDHFAPDRAAGEATLRVWPSLRIHMRANRSFMHRVARYLAAEKGIRQILEGLAWAFLPVPVRSGAVVSVQVNPGFGGAGLVGAWRVFRSVRGRSDPSG